MSADFTTARLNMVESQVRTQDVTDTAIHDAMRFWFERQHLFQRRAIDQHGNERVIKHKNFVGRAEVIFFSAKVDEPGALRWWSPWTWPFDIRWNRFFHLVR